MNTLFAGDNLRVLTGRDASGDPFIRPGSVDAVYLDPPYNSGRDYSTDKPIGRAKVGAKAFTDTFRWDDRAAAIFGQLAANSPPRLAAMLDVLGTVYPASSRLAYVAFMAPRLIALRRTLTPTGALWLQCDDSANNVLAMILEGVFGSGTGYSVVWRRTAGSHGNRKGGFPRIHDTLLHYRKARPKNASLTRYGGWHGTVWDDDGVRPLNAQARERTGYPTQKPLALLRRIIHFGTRSGDTVLDPFCGSGTALVAAHETGRRFIGIDLSTLAGSVAGTRLDAAGATYRTVAVPALNTREAA